MSEDSPVSRTTSLADSQPKHSDVLQSNASPRDDRASVTLYALVAVGLLAVSLVAVFVISGGVLDGDSPADDVDNSEPAGDTDPTPVNDSSDDNDSSETVETHGESDSDENTTDSRDGTDDSPTDDSPTNDDENTNNTDSDGDSDDSEDGASPTDKEEVYVDVQIYDLGFPEKGKMRLREAGSEEVVETHNFSDEGHSREFRYLDPSQQYELTVETPYYPETTVGFRADLKDRMDVTVGYEFNSTDSYLIDWEVDYLPQYFDGDHTSERAEEVAIPLTGVTRSDQAGNNYVAWDDPEIPGKVQYYYNKSTNRTFRNPEGPSYSWRETEAHYGDLSSTASKVIEKGLSGVEQRRFLRTEEPGGFINKLHVYEVDASVFGDPILAMINPESGYPNNIEIQVEKMSESDATYSISEYEIVEAEISTIPPEFPVKKFSLNR